MWSVGKERRLNSVIAYSSMVLVIVATVGACLLRGFFFTEEMYPFLTLWYVLCGGITLYVLIAGGVGRSGGGGVNKAIKIMLSSSLIVLSLYVIQWLRSPLTSQGTMNEILRWGLYASFAFLVYFCTANRVGRRFLKVAWSVLGMVLSMSALLAVCGWVELPFAVAYSNSSEVSATGARLAGLIEYPNTFGVVMAVFLLERLFAVAAFFERTRAHTQSVTRVGEGRNEGTETDRVVEVEFGSEGTEIKCAELGSSPAALLRLLPLFPYAAALLLSESRGAWLTAACACAAVLLWKRQLIAPLLAAGAAPVVAAALLYRQLARAGLAVEPLPGLLALAGLWAGALLAGLWLCRRERRAAGSARAAMLALAAAGWTAAGTAVLLHVRERITGPTSTVSARGLFYRDAWRLAAEAPWLGRGGETWRSSYLAAQSRPYVGSQVHSGYLDILLNLGIVGLAAILLMLLAAGWILATRSPRLLPPFLVIVLHSAVDFDWSYGLIWLLLLWLPALALTESDQKLKFMTAHPKSTNPLAKRPATANSLAKHPVTANPLAKRPATANSLAKDPVTANPLAKRPATANSLAKHPATANPLAKHPATANPFTIRPISANPSTTRSGAARFPTRAHSLTRRVCMTLACCICLLLSLLSFHAAQGESYFRTAAQATDPLMKEKLLQQSLAWNPRSPRTAIALSRLVSGEQSVYILQQSLQYSPEDASLSWEMAKRVMSGDQPDPALYWLHRSLKLDVYNNAKWVQAVEGMLIMGQKKLAIGDRIEAIKCVASGSELLRQYRMLAEQEASRGSQHNDRKFHLTEQSDDLSRWISVLVSRF